MDRMNHNDTIREHFRSILTVVVLLSMISGLERCNGFMGSNRYYWADISIDSIGAIKRGDTCKVNGRVEGTQPIDSIGYSINDSLGDPVTKQYIGILYKPCKGKNTVDFRTDASLAIVVKPAAPDGDYWVSIEVMTGSYKFLRMKQFFIRPFDTEVPSP
jgi:hypothetical protein